MNRPLHTMSAAALAAAIQRREVSSREVIDAHLARIDAINPQINALPVVMAEQAQSQADAADRRLARAQPTGPLHGVPITVKENIDVADTATTRGVTAYKNAIAAQDAPVISHLKTAGAIVIGRSNMPDFGMRWHTDNALHGATVNPWHSQRTPGGSSGGEAAAVATGMSALGIGNDMGGSTRQPAINCGVCGLRPSTGRVSRIMTTSVDDVPMFYEQIACVNGPIARTVEDLQLALSILQQADPSDPIWQPTAIPPAPPVDRRVGLITQLDGDTTAPAVVRALHKAANALAVAGYEIERTEAPLLALADDTIQRLAQFEVNDYLQDMLVMLSDDARSFLLTAIGSESVDGAGYRDAIAQRYRVARHWRGHLEKFPLVLGPVSTMEPFAIGADIGDTDVVRRIIRSFRLTELCNLLGLPALALPVSIENHLPQGVQLIARRFDEARCFQAARVIEKSANVVTPIDPVHQPE